MNIAREEVRALLSAAAVLAARQTTASATKQRFFATPGVMEKFLTLNVLAMIKIQ